MRPSTFSEGERRGFQEEKMLLRQFMLMKQQDGVPDSVSVRHMKTWLRSRRNFLNEFQEVIQKSGKDRFFMAELTWTTARHFCINLMEKELMEELERERQLSQLFNRKVTLEGLSKFLSVIRRGAEDDVLSSLSSLHKKLLQSFLGLIVIPRGALSAGDAVSRELLELEQLTAPVVPQVVDTVLQFLLEEPEEGKKGKAVSAEIGRLLFQAVVPFLSLHMTVDKSLLLWVCTNVAKCTVRAINRRFLKDYESFEQLDQDESISARNRVISAIRDMTGEGQSPPSSQTSVQVEEAVSSEGEEDVEEREASTQLLLDEETSEDTSTVSMDTSLTLSCDIQPEEEEKKDSEGQEPLIQDSETREASPDTEVEEEEDQMASSQEQLTESTSLLSLDTNTTPEDSDQEVQPETPSQVPEASTSEAAEERLVEERGASPQVTASEELEEEDQEVPESSANTLDDLTDASPQVTEETNVSINHHDQELDVEHKEEEVSCETEETPSEVSKEKKKKRRGVKAFFRGVWKRMTSCVRPSTKE